jgi:hypothetical protein
MVLMKTKDARTCTNFWLFSFSALGPALIPTGCPQLHQNRSCSGEGFYEFVQLHAEEFRDSTRR